MKGNKISIKLFLITSTVFILFISVTLIFQVLFFQKYYVSKKLDNFKSDFNKLSHEVNTNKINQDTAINKFRTFDDTNNAKSIELNITGFDYHLMNGTLESDLGYIFYTFDKKVNVTTIHMLLREWVLINQSEARDYIMGEKKTLIYQKTINNTNYIIGVSPIVKNGEVNNIIFSMVSLQPVGDAVKTMKEFYVYIYVFALVLILALSLMYSLMISKPLVKLKKAAAKMTDLDFSTKCEVKSKDEIGELGSILNFLSEKLDKTLTELKDSNEKLKDDIEKEKQLEIMRKEFVAGVSHELKTPITLIGGYAEALKDNVVEAEDKAFFLEVILDESQKMDLLIKDMLDLSQLETGNLKMDFEDFDIYELLEFVLKKFSRKITEKNLELTANITGKYAIVTGDTLRIEQVMINLLSNAIRYAKEGGLIIVNVEEYNGELVISVENEGQQIAEEEIDKIWERFYKIDKSRNRESEGTGIGLSIVKNILLLHRSSFGVENTDLGVKFKFSLNKIGLAEDK